MKALKKFKTQKAFDKALRQIEREINRGVDKEVRRRWREEYGLIYVKEYTVAAHFRVTRAKPKRKKRKPKLKVLKGGRR